MRNLLIAALSLCLAAATAQAQVTSLDGCTLGEHWYGPENTLDDLKGRVVIVEMWGYNCPPCRASLPHMVSLQRKHAGKGLVVLGFHRQAATLKAQVLALAAQRKINYQITQGGALTGDTSRGIPRAFLFDWTGKKIWEGSPSGLDGPTEELLARAPHWLTRGRELKDAKVAALSKALYRPTGYGSMIGKLDRMAEKADEGSAQKEEAAYLRDAIASYGASQLDRAAALERTAPDEAYSHYQTLARQYKGHEVADKASARRKELSKDKAFQDELKAMRVYRQIEGLQPDCKAGELCRSAQQVRALTIALQKRYATTVAARLAREVCADLKLELPQQ